MPGQTVRLIPVQGEEVWEKGVTESKSQEPRSYVVRMAGDSVGIFVPLVSVHQILNVNLCLKVSLLILATAVSLLTERDWRPLLMELVLGKT